MIIYGSVVQKIDHWGRDIIVRHITIKEISPEERDFVNHNLVKIIDKCPEGILLPGYEREESDVGGSFDGGDLHIRIVDHKLVDFVVGEI